MDLCLWGGHLGGWEWDGPFELGLAVPVVHSATLLRAANADEVSFPGKIVLLITDIDRLLASRTPNVQHLGMSLRFW